MQRDPEAPDASPKPYLLVAPDLTIVAANPAYLRATGRTADDLIGRHIFDAFPAAPAAALETLSGKVRELEEARSHQAFQLALADTLRTLATPAEIFRATCRLLGEQLHASRVTIGDYDSEKQAITFHSGWQPAGTEPLEGIHPAASFGLENFESLRDGSLWVSHDLSVDPRTRGADRWPLFQSLQIRSGAVAPLLQAGVLTACVFVNDARPREWSEAETMLIKDAADRMWVAMERARAEQALKQADRRKDQFLAMLAHELRNPLAPISSAAALLKMTGLPPESVFRTSEIISRQVKHMTGLVDDLLDVSRVSTGRVLLAREEVELRLVVSEAVEQTRPMFEARRHQFTSHPIAGDARVIGDHKRLVQVVANLLNNAAKYTPEGGRISAGVDVQGDRVCITVADNGLGVAPELLPHLFEPFSQAERTSDRSQGGLGIGLALVRSLVELHGGSVAARSDGLGQGSTFEVRLARLRVPSEPRPLVLPEETELVGGGEAVRVLVVDDNVDAANMLAMLLQATGYRVEVESDSLRALSRAQGQEFDAFLLDIGLPGMDGYELARRLRSTIPRGGGKRFIAVTGYGSPYDRAAALEAGFDEHLVKPADPAQILKLLKLLKQPRAEPVSAGPAAARP